jgi:leucyl-tRNA synthetase
MGVPAHDERDFEFAVKYGFEITQTIAKNIIFTGESALREGVETLNRQVVDVILENQKGEFLLIEENNPKNFHFIGGGIEA